ncbi:hypothetical protein GIY56_12240 [Paracoccus sp. YIM 132242]|uniref:Uncharacterized protein n=1 Tax=Paracoccus lichenicola TaxID=2665644 RepID=A0A6L6HSM3_9RHOB|nr:hypothetical protein [Paracoccus lichenicola]MTE01065.1 hypothetical protein [Paracoccus lichenicola]
MRDAEKDMDLDKDQTTRPSLRKGDGPIPPSGSARQPVHDPRTTPAPASDDPTE